MPAGDVIETYTAQADARAQAGVLAPAFAYPIVVTAARRFITGAAGIKRLYRQVLREVSRVMKPGGRGVFLTKRADVFREALHKEMKIAHQTEPIAVLGQRARLIVVHRMSG